jgi:sodium-dependent dicarboxylate transporter 2/3/5
MIFLTELTSNTATAATFLPIGGAVAVGLGLDPLMLTVPLALAASCAFMLPVATPPMLFSQARGTPYRCSVTGNSIELFELSTSGNYVPTC